MRKAITTAILTGTMVLALLVAAPAQASPIYVKGTGLGISGLEIMGPHYFRAFAGQVLLDSGLADTSDDFYAYCVDATKSRDLIQDMNVRPLSELPDNGNPANAQPGAGARVAWLLNTYAKSAWLATDGDNRAAALQLAIWEVLYEPFGSYDIASGTFRLVYPGNYTALLSYTSLYFASLGTNTSEAIWLDVSDPALTTGQDFARPIPNPEPASILLFGTGMLGLARSTWLRRRQ
jgi:hypothetical protein